MPATCALTGKTYKMTVKRSHSMRGTLTKVKANLQRIRIGNKLVKLSTRAIRTMKKYSNKSFPLVVSQ
ncbi:MAG: 50S ribosomal protein L28 [Candidatus Parcubacteria bacterium]|nr:50S ribosomal protein L28 [Candidatus Paceibacterota bacterium]